MLKSETEGRRIIDFGSERRKRAAIPNSAQSTFPLPARKQSELFVGFTFRVAMSAQFNGRPLFEHGLGAHVVELCIGKGIKERNPLINALQAWTDSVVAHSSREIITHQEGVLGLSRDECLAASLIAACQFGRTGAAKSSAYALLDHDIGVDNLVAVSVAMARTFFNNWIELHTDAIANVVVQTSIWPDRH